MRTQAPAPNTVVWIRQRPWRIERAIRDRDVMQFDVVRGDERATFLAPFDRPIAGRSDRRLVRVRAQHGLAKVAASLADRWSLRMVAAARDARISLLPHQLEPALAVLEGHRRVLVADDVGLGKTIEAGLVMAELVRRSPACRILVVAPAGLCPQWAEELASRFSLPTRCALDRSVVDTDSAARSRWRHPGVWLTSADYIKQPHVLSGLPLAPWDLVVIDEAHTVAGRTDRHDACAELVRRARHALLLSATPHSGDVGRFARLLGLGALETTEALLVFRRTRESVGLPRRRNVRWTRTRITGRASEALDALRQFECAVLALGRPTRRDALLLLLSVFRRRALSSFAAFVRSLERRLTWLTEQEAGAPRDAVQRNLEFGDTDDDVREEESALTADAGVTPADERRLIRDLIRITRGALVDDPKLARISRLLRRSREPVVIFTEFRDSLEAVREIASRDRETSVLHGDQSEAERCRELARFLEGQASVLIATDVAGQGLNLQSRARWIVNLELPWNPARLEQRIGRVDRLGQQRVVHASILLARHQAEAVLVQSLARRAAVAGRALAGDLDAPEAPPSPLALAAAVVGGEPLAMTSTGVSLPAPSTSWVRTARANVAVLTRHRRWRTSWRGSMDRQGRPVEFSSRRRSSATPHACAILGFSIPILDSCGLVVERHLVAVSVAHAGVLSDLTCHRAADEALRLARRRLTRATAIGAACSTRRQLVERALGRHLISLCRSGESQPELFTRRTLRLLNRARTEADRIRDTVSARLVRETAGSNLSMGSPELVWLWRRR